MSLARPILFSGPMVRALISGAKTQTRRLVKPQPNSVKNFGIPIPYRLAPPPIGMPSATLEVPIRCPYGEPGDLLWVRESHALVPVTAYRMSEGVQQAVNPFDCYEAAIYAAGWERSIPKWRPSIHMPRWASRLTLEITDVRVERLNDLRQLLHVEPQRHVVDRVKVALRLTSDQAIIVAALFEAYPKRLPVERLNMALPSRGPDDEREINTVKVQISHIRRRLGKDAVLNLPKRGYTLGPAVVEAVKRALGEAA